MSWHGVVQTRANDNRGKGGGEGRTDSGKILLFFLFRLPFYPPRFHPWAIRGIQHLSVWWFKCCRKLCLRLRRSLPQYFICSIFHFLSVSWGTPFLKDLQICIYFLSYSFVSSFWAPSLMPDLLLPFFNLISNFIAGICLAIISQSFCRQMCCNKLFFTITVIDLWQNKKLRTFLLKSLPVWRRRNAFLKKPNVRTVNQRNNSIIRKSFWNV